MARCGMRVSLHLAKWRSIIESELDKDRIVEEGNLHKFTKGKESPEMLKKLLETGDRELVEVMRLTSRLMRVKLLMKHRRLRTTEYGALDLVRRMQKRTETIGVRTCLGLQS